jgi:hypothetical protein
MPTLAKGAWEIIEQNIDIFINLFYEGDKRMMQIMGDDHVAAGHNLDSRFRYTDGNRIKTISMGKNKQEAYDNLIKGFNNQLIKPIKKEESAKEAKSYKKEK